MGLCKDNEPVRILESLVRKEGEEGKMGRERGDLFYSENLFRLLGSLSNPTRSHLPFIKWHSSLQVLKPRAVEMGVMVLS